MREKDIGIICKEDEVSNFGAHGEIIYVNKKQERA
jgi:hypothetical protein